MKKNTKMAFAIAAAAAFATPAFPETRIQDEPTDALVLSGAYAQNALQCVGKILPDLRVNSDADPSDDRADMPVSAASSIDVKIGGDGATRFKGFHIVVEPSVAVTGLFTKMDGKYIVLTPDLKLEGGADSKAAEVVHAVYGGCIRPAVARMTFTAAPK